MAQAPALPRGFELPLEPRLPRIGSVDAVALEERARLAREALDQEGREGLRARARDPLHGPDDARGRRHAGQGRRALLEGDPARSVATRRSRRVAAICVYENLVPTCVERLARHRRARSPPSRPASRPGQYPTDLKVADVRRAVELGADEIDMVIDRGAFLSGRYAKVYDEIVQVKEAVGDAHLKVILETGELGTYDNVRRASLLAMAAGADFIKTSTGKIPRAATLPVALCMLEAIRDVHEETGRVVGFKPAGGMRAREAGDPAPRARARDARPGLADARPLPHRRLVAAERHASCSSARRRRARTRARTTSPLTDLDRKQDRAPVPKDWTYAPAPESRDIVSCASATATSSAASGSRPTETYETISPRDEEPLAAVGQATEEDVDAAVAAARAAFANGWSALPGSERAKYLFRIARILQERAREFAVLESLNGGKPIKESRDVDLPLAAAHFFYYAGWADKLEYAFPNRKPKPVGVAGQIIPWNFPLLMLAWKIAPALACGNTVVLKPAETTPLTALLFCDVLRQAELPPGVVNIVTGDGRTGAALVEHPGRRQDRVHRLDRGRQGDPAPARRHRQEAHARARRQGREHRLRRLRARPGRRGDRQRHLLQPGPRVLRRLAPLRAGVDLRAARREAEAAPRDAARRRPARQEHRRRRDQLAHAAREDPGARRRPARRRAPRSTSRRAACRRRATGSRRPSSRTSRRATASRRRRSSARCSRVLTFRTPEEAVEKANNTPYGLSAGVWTEKGSRILWMAQQLRAGVVWANTFNRFDPTSPFGGYKESGFGREGGLHGLEPYLRFDESEPSVADRSPSRRRTSCSSAARSRAASPAARTRRRGRTSRAPRARTRATPCRRRAPRSRAGRRRPRTTAARCSTASPRWSRRASPSSPSSAPAATRSSARSIGSSGTPAGPTSCRRCSAARTRSPARTSTSRVPEPTGVVAVLAPDEPPLLGLVTRLMPPLVGGNAVVAVASETHPLAAIELAEAIATSDVPGGVVNLLTGFRDELGPGLASHMDVNAIDLCGADGSPPSSSSSRPRTSSASSAAAPTRRARGRSRASSS